MGVQGLFQHQQSHMLEGMRAVGANPRLIWKGALGGTIRWSKAPASMSFGKSCIKLQLLLGHSIKVLALSKQRVDSLVVLS